MSASASKKKRKELEAQGISQKEIRAQKETDKRKKTTRTVLLSVLAVLLVAAIVVGVIALLNNRYRQTVATVGDSKITVPVYNCFYNSTAIEVAQQGVWIGYGYYPVSVTGGVSFSEQNNPLGEGTLEDFMIDYTNSRIQSVYNLYNKAKSDSSFSLSQEGKDSIAATLENIKSEAEEHGFGSADKYLQASVGRGVTLEDYETYLTVTTTASEYDAFVRDTFEPSDEELAAAYNEDPSSYDIVRMTYSVTNSTGTVDKESEDKEMVYTDEDRAKAKAEAEAKEAEMPEDATETHVQKAQLSSYEEIAEWLFDSARKEGDVKTFQVDEDGNTYWTVRFDGRDTNDYNRVTAYVISIEKDKVPEAEEPADAETAEEPADGETAEEPADAEGEEPAEEPAEGEDGEAADADADGEKKDEEQEEEKETAEETLAKILDGMTADMSDEDFETYIKDQYKAVSSSVVDKNDYPEEVNEYLFSADRKAGDFETITTEDTYYVVRYVSTNETTYRNELVKDAMFTELYNSILSASSLDLNKKALKYANTDLVFNTSAVS